MPGQRRWTQVRIVIDEALQDELVGALIPLGFSGFLQETDFVVCTASAAAWKNSIALQFPRALEQFTLEHSLPAINWTSDILRERNWNRRWEAHTGIVEATPRIIIKPSWVALRKKDKGKIILRIDPKMSFGTGHHETTRLCLRLLERYAHSGGSVLDLGTGTGVLAIAAAKLGVKGVLGLDNDSWSVLNARENVRRNRVQGIVRIRRAGVEKTPPRPYPLVTANIDFLTISNHADSIIRSVAHAGHLLLSGILTIDAPRLLPLFQREFQLLETITEGEWSAFALYRF